MLKRKARPVTVSAPQKGSSKQKGRIPLDKLLAAHISGRRAVATKKAPVRTPATAKSGENEAKESP